MNSITKHDENVLQKRVKVDFQYFIQSAIQKKIAWNALAYFLTDLAPTLDQSKEIIKTLVQELEIWVSKVTNKSDSDIEIVEVSENPTLIDDQNITQRAGNIDEVEILESNNFEIPVDPQDVYYETINENSSSEMQNINQEKNVFQANSETTPAADFHEQENIQSESLKISIKKEKSNHNSKNLARKTFECDICLKTLKSKQALQFHHRTHTGEKPYKCDSCEASYSMKSSLKQHLYKHTGEKSSKCKSDNEIYENSATNQNDTKGVEKANEVNILEPNNSATPTDHQDANFSSETEMSDIGNEHQNSPKSAEREISTYKQNQSIKNDAKKNFECEFCFKTLKSKHAMQVHKRIHTGEKPFKCESCDASYVAKSLLKKHSYQHAEEKPFKCSNCKMSFIQLCDLKKHQRTHTGEKPFQCKYCGKEFSHRFSWRGHEMLHTGERPHKCSMCGKGFIQSSELRMHVRRHTGDKPYKCKVCKKSFSQWGNMNTHLTNQHTDQIQDL